jgi:hypothetical protein
MKNVSKLANTKKQKKSAAPLIFAALLVKCKSTDECLTTTRASNGSDNHAMSVITTRADSGSDSHTSNSSTSEPASTWQLDNFNAFD